MLAHRLPGIAFHAEPPPRDEVLPRMDVAAFVGFASSGPVGVPVAVEDLGRFRDLFGEDPVLAWDEERGQSVRGHLGPAVAAFFRNGGVRCFVVRVADPETVQHHRLPVDGLAWHPEAGAATELHGADVAARSPGGWVESLRAGSVLERRAVPIGRGADEPFSASAGAYRLETLAPGGAVVTGDLLEIAFGDGGPLLLLFADRLEMTAGGLRIEAGSAWWLAPASSSPPESPPGSSPSAQTALWQSVSEATGLDLLADWRASSPPPRAPAVRRLTFELVAWREEALVARLGGLGFRRDHPRFWGHLPSDDELFALTEGRPVAIEPASITALDDEASSPRFPFAAPPEASDESATGAAFFLPVRPGSAGHLRLMADRLDPERARGVSSLPGSRLERDGLDRFAADLFLDRDLTHTGSRALLSAAEHKRYLRGESLGGLHALLPVAEATLLAVPDAVHGGWTRDAPELPPLLEAPILEAVDVEASAEDAALELRWSEVPGTTGYRLEVSADAAFTAPRTVYEGAERRVSPPPEDDCPRRHYYRVRARRGGEISPWSETVFRLRPPSDFVACRDHHLLFAEVAPEVSLLPLAGGSHRLEWTAVPGAAAYRVESSNEPAFLEPRTLFEGPGLSLVLAPRHGGVSYLRVAAVRGGEAGPRSRTAVLRPSSRTDHVLRDAEDSAPVLLDVQRALLRFAAARGDLLALLSLPRHFRDAETRDHLGALEPASRPATTPPGPPIGFTTVPPLTAGEEDVLSFGALYHPWLAANPEAGSAHEGVPVFSPAEGAVAGTMARLALERGAWWAPANQPLGGVLALDPGLSDETWRQLAPLGVNLVRRHPRGFLVLGADTLSRRTELRPIPVRRLLILIRRLALREGARYVFEPNDDDFQALVQHRFERFLSGLFVRGAFAGRSAAHAFRVVTDESVNPPASRDLGRFIVELRVAPSRPLDFLTVRLVQTGPEQVSLQEGAA